MAVVTLTVKSTYPPPKKKKKKKVLVSCNWDSFIRYLFAECVRLTCFCCNREGGDGGGGFMERTLCWMALFIEFDCICSGSKVLFATYFGAKG